MKKCECQAESADDAVYCASCGRRLPETVVADTKPAPVESVASIATNARRQKRVMVIIASFVATALVVALGLTYLLRNVHITINGSSLVSVPLPLNVCHTSVASPIDTPQKLPATVQVQIATALSTQVAVYSDNEGVVEVLAPTGWTCTAIIGANGSSSVTVSPSGQSAVSSAALPPGSTVEVINAGQTSACASCRTSLACPLFASAENDYRHAFGHACPATRPTAERVTKVNGHLADFTDPPGVRGDAVPSGGAYPAMGVMTYFGDSTTNGSWTETCVLPPTETSLCTAILGNFASNYGNL